MSGSGRPLAEFTMLMIGLDVGEDDFLEDPHKDSRGRCRSVTPYVRSARKFMGEPGAQFVFKHTAKGVRVKRVA